LPAAPPAEDFGGPGARFLRERARALTVPGWAEMRAPLLPLCRDERVEPHREPPLCGSVYHLVATADLDAYAARARSLAGPLRVVVSGPFPPYAFAEAP
jgi:hypothetical protein